MESRFHIDNKRHMIEFPHTREGHFKAVVFRNNTKEFRYCRIKDVLQAQPTQIPLETLIEIK